MPTARRLLPIVLILLNLAPAPLFAQTVEERKNLQMSATIPADENDFEVAITSPTTGSPFPQDTEIEYKITYGSTLTNSVNPFKVVASWSRGTIAGESSPSVDVLTYVVGSAEDAYDNTTPVIDTVNRKITWDINTFPANTQDQTVTFRLQTTDAYTGSGLVDFEVSARIEGPGVVTDENTVTHAYDFDESRLLTPTPAPTATPGPVTPGATGTPTPTPIRPEQAFGFDRIDIQTISAEDASIFAELTKPATLRLFYGTSPSAMNRTINALTANTEHAIQLPDLDPETDYYFRITATDASGRQITSDIFLFKTARVSEAPEVDTRSLVVTSSDVVLLSPSLLTSSQTPMIVMPTDSVFDFQFELARHPSVRRLQAIVRPQVLGLSTFAKPVNANTEAVDMTEIRPGVYSGRLRTTQQTGSYTLAARIFDTDGNISEDAVANVRVTSPLTVLEEGSGRPIENARVLLSFYNSKRESFEPLSPQSFPVENPGFTNTDGELRFALPHGRYKAEVRTESGGKTTREFTIGPQNSEGYPVIYLPKGSFNIVNTAKYYGAVCLEVIRATGSYFGNLTGSTRFFDLLSLLTVIFFFSLLLRSLSLRLGVPVYRLPALLKHPTEIYELFWSSNTVISGRVIDSSSEKGLSGAYVFVYKHGNELLASCRTDRRGGFKIRNLPPGGHRIAVSKNGYHGLHVFRESFDTVQISLTKSDTYHNAVDHLQHFIKLLAGLSFEMLLLLSVIAEILFAFSFGWLMAAPFLILSGLNLLLWLGQHNHVEESTAV